MLSRDDTFLRVFLWERLEKNIVINALFYDILKGRLIEKGAGKWIETIYAGAAAVRNISTAI